MKIVVPGHVYELDHLDGDCTTIIHFVNRETTHGSEGIQNQEVLRALIDRVQHCDRRLAWQGNQKILHHLRMALVLHEARALERKTENGSLKPENVATNFDGHFLLELL